MVDKGRQYRGPLQNYASRQAPCGGDWIAQSGGDVTGVKSEQGERSRFALAWLQPLSRLDRSFYSAICRAMDDRCCFYTVPPSFVQDGTFLHPSMVQIGLEQTFCRACPGDPASNDPDDPQFSMSWACRNTGFRASSHR